MNNKIAKMIVCIMMVFSFKAGAGSYTAYVEKLQVEGVGEDHNTIYLDLDIKDSPCTSTNSLNRFTLKNDAQQSAALIALMTKKKITLHTHGICNSSIEEVNYIMLFSHQ